MNSNPTTVPHDEPQPSAGIKLDPFEYDADRLHQVLADPFLTIRSNALMAALNAYTDAPFGLPVLRRLAIAIDAYEAAMIRPIAECPRDGTNVLIFEPGCDTNWIEDFWDEDAPGGADFSVSPDGNATHFRIPPSSPATEVALATYDAEHHPHG